MIPKQKLRFVLYYKFLVLSLYMCDEWKMWCEVILPRNKVKGEITEHDVLKWDWIANCVHCGKYRPYKVVSKRVPHKKI